MLSINTEQYIEAIKRSNEACKNDQLVVYASTHKNKEKGTSLKELVKSCDTEGFTLESVLGIDK